MFPAKNVLSSSRRRFRSCVSTSASFSYHANAAVLRSNSAQKQVGAQNHGQVAGNPFEAHEVSISHKCEFLIEKYRFSRSDLEAKQFHSDVIKNGFVGDLFMGNSLINAYSRSGNMRSAHNVFDEMPDKNSVSWSCLISGYTQNECPKKALTALGRMVSAGFTPNHYAIGSALRSCQRLGGEGLKCGLQIHGLVSKTQHASDVVVCNVLISMYGNCIAGSVGSDFAHRVFDGIANRNSVSWNSMISVYSQRGDADSAFRLFSDMQKEGSGFGFRPTEYTFGSLISVASESLNTSKGSFLLKQLLAKIQMFGLLEDLYVGSALVSAFARTGGVDIAKNIFQGMSTRNAISLNGLVVGLVKLKRGEEAVEVFSETRDLVRLNSDSYVHLLSAFGEISCEEKGRRKGKEVHGHLTRTGMIDSSISVGNSLINMYAKCGAVEDACSVFNSMVVDKDSVSWSSMISGFDQNGRFEDALLSFCRMKRIGLVPSNYTLISTLSSCSSLGWMILGEQIHSEAVKLGLDFDVSVSNTLLSLYADTCCVTECRKLFSLMHDHDQVSWNIIVRAFSDSDASVIEAIRYFKEMMRVGRSPNNVTFINILAAAASLSCADLAHQLHAMVLKSRLMDDKAVVSSLLTCYGKCREMTYCEKIFSTMAETDDSSWNSMISGYIHNELLTEAMHLVWLRLHNGQRLDRFTFATVLSACASVATLEHGMEIHACATKDSLISDVVIGSALIDMYAKCGRIEYASRFFELMPLRNVYSWNSMISGYARHGDGHKAIELFAQMKQENQLPDHVTFVGVLSACSHVGLVKQGYEHFESMKRDYNLEPRIEHFSCVADLLGRAGEFGKLEEFINRMPIEPNVLIWRTVLGACGRANGRLLDLGRRASQRLKELEPQNAVNYVLLANMYASTEKWEHVAESRHEMKAAAARKEAGCSWVTMKDGIHVFVSGDKSHPETDAIYEKIGELREKMKAAGYVPQVNYALYDLEEENKEEILSYHSEKLAVAFVLTRKSELPIRIMKNLRVCGDCHEAFKYVSRIVRRQIVLRDSNRFHHFVDGRCSCNDFW